MICVVFVELLSDGLQANLSVQTLDIQMDSLFVVSREEGVIIDMLAKWRDTKALQTTNERCILDTLIRQAITQRTILQIMA